MRFLWLLFALFSSNWTTWAEVKNLPSFVPRDRFRYIDITFPQDNEFFENKLNKSTSTVGIAEPFVLRDNYLTDSNRYGIERYPFVSLVTLSYYAPFSIAIFNLKNDVLKEKGVEILRVEPKKAKATGVIMLVREISYNTETDFLKWVAIFGNEIQTIIVLGIFPENQESNVSEMLRRIVENADYGLPQSDKGKQSQKEAKQKPPPKSAPASH